MFYLSEMAPGVVNPNRTGLFLTCLGLGGRHAPSIIFVVCGPIATKFCTGLTIKALAPKIYIKLMTS